MTHPSVEEASSFRMPEPRRISNSEVGTWLLCRRKYYYTFDLNIVPKQRSSALSRGILGHEVLQVYYDALREGKPHALAKTEARALLMRAMDSYNLELVTDLDLILGRYWNHYAEIDLQEYEILEVENNYDLPLVDDFDYTFRFDLYLKHKLTGKRILMDHKFIWDFWNADKIALSPQFPKYVGAMRGNDLAVDECILNQIRYRPIKEPTPDQLFRRSKVIPSNAKIRNALKEQMVSSREIAAHRFMPVELRSDHAVGVRNPLVCNYCEFAQLCASEYDGGDVQYMIQNDYTSNPYGYNAPTTEGL